VQGVGGNRFDPDGRLTREQAATMLLRLSAAIGTPPDSNAATFSDITEVSSWALEGVGQMQAMGIMFGTGFDNFSPKDPYNREQSIVTFFRMYNWFVDSSQSIDCKAWAIGCSAILATRNRYEPNQYGMFSVNTQNKTKAISLLLESWGCDNREELINTIKRMTDNGHNTEFAKAYEVVVSLTPNEYKALLETSGTTDKYMWPLTKDLGDKWGDTQIKAWDWFRMIHLTGWGYVAGYLTLEESHTHMLPVIKLLYSTFSSWEEACDNYMDGYAWWSRTDISKSDTEYKHRLSIYQEIKDNGTLFNQAVWN
jgi:hypothetical protein